MCMCSPGRVVRAMSMLYIDMTKGLVPMNKETSLLETHYIDCCGSCVGKTDLRMALELFLFSHFSFELLHQLLLVHALAPVPILFAQQLLPAGFHQLFFSTLQLFTLRGSRFPAEVVIMAICRMD